MNKLIVGQKFNRLEFVSLDSERAADKHLVGLWKCECGKMKAIIISRVVHGISKSCGCLMRETKPALTHGMKGSRTYSSWSSMKRRCEAPKDKDYYRYGAMGIRVCERWMCFENFFEDMGSRPPGTSLDRIDGAKGYEPENCRWATPVVQARNNCKFVVIRTPLGIMPLVDYAAHLNISRGAAHLRFKRGKLKGCSSI